MIVLLKKLTRKSTIQAGKNAGLLVGDILKKCKLDIIYSYFHYGCLTYTDDILDEVNILPEDRIAKPGKAPEKYEFYLERNIGKRDVAVAVRRYLKRDEEGLKKAHSLIENKNAKRKLAARVGRERIFWSKGAMQFRNHQK